MLEVLQYIFSSFWVFLGTVVLIGVTLEGFAACLKGWRGQT